MIAPVKAGDLNEIADRPMAMVLVRDTQSKGGSTPETLQPLFGLTRTEARLAHWLAEGRSVEDFARTRDVSLNTARSQVKSLLQKTGTRRQAELVALVYRYFFDIEKWLL